MTFWQTYCYVDAFYEHPVSKQRMPWQRIRIDDVYKRIVNSARQANCFITVQRFKDATSLRDSSPSAESLTVAPPSEPIGEAELLPSQQSHYHGLYFDFDCDHKKLNIEHSDAIERARRDVVKLVKWIHDTFELNPAHVQIWFSGSKGFHVLVRPEPFGIKPHHHLTYIVRNIASEIAEDLGIRTLDQSVYTVGRMWRITNTVHPSTGRYKIELDHNEILRWSAQQIMDYAKGPRVNSDNPDPMTPSQIYDPCEYKNIGPEIEAVRWWADRYAQYDAYQDLLRIKPRYPIRIPNDSAADDWPACVKDIMQNGPKQNGPNRNRVILPLAGFMHDVNLPQDESSRLIDDWTRKFFPADRYLRQRIANGRSVVSSAYRGHVNFACRFIRSLGGSGERGRVACVGEVECPWVKKPDDQEPATVPMIHLSEASKGCYINTKVRTAIHVAAKATRRYEIPLKGSVHCVPDPEAKICQRCSNRVGEGNGALEFEVHADERPTLNMINVNDNMRKAAIKAKCGIPSKCYQHRFDIDMSGNVEELQVIPMVDYAQAYVDMMGSDDDPSRKHLEHVVEVAYHLGHGIEANKKYVIDATVFGHPKDQRICFLFDKFDAAQNDIDQFRLNDALKRKLAVFRQGRGQTVEEKLLEIHRDLTANVHQIGGRFDLSIAVDLCYHSVIGFMFASKFIHKGWFELLVCGDTGCGKSLADRTPVLTPRGWKEVQRIQAGDEVIGSDGCVTGVVGVYPQGELDVYEVKFEDGASVVCSEDHLWSLTDHTTITTAEIRKRMDQGYVCDVPSLVAVEFEPRSAPRVRAWDIGAAIMGRGCTHEVVTRLRMAELPSSMWAIPDEYLWADVATRHELLTSICWRQGRVASFEVPSRDLADDIVHVARSLGYFAYTDELRVTVDRTRGVGRRIREIVPAGRSSCTCIKVLASDGLFVTKDFVLTHNTTLVERIMQHYGLGELIAGETSKRTGLVHANLQLQGQWILRWGKIPQNDRRLLVIDEFGSIPPEEVGKMTQLRSEGKARGSGVNADHETWARTRLIFLTNPRGNRGSLQGYNYGVQAVDGLFDERQDLRRVDLAVMAEKREVRSEYINKRWDRVDIPHRYTADLCRNMVLWAWSREPHHIKWDEGAEDEVILWADRLGDTYDCDLPLAERADLRLKIARISAAVATRLFSTDEEAKNVYVRAEHVQFAANFMDRLYRKPSMSYFEYARKYKQDNNFTEERKERIRRVFEGIDEHENIVAALLEVDILTKPVFADMVNLENDELRRLWKYMVGERLLRKTSRGYRKTGAFTQFLKTLGSAKSGYQGDLGDGFEMGGMMQDDEVFEETVSYEDVPF